MRCGRTWLGRRTKRRHPAGQAPRIAPAAVSAVLPSSTARVNTATDSSTKVTPKMAGFDPYSTSALVKPTAAIQGLLSATCQIALGAK